MPFHHLKASIFSSEKLVVISLLIFKTRQFFFFFLNPDSFKMFTFSMVSSALLLLLLLLVAKLCLSLWDPIDYSPPGSSAYGISLARISRWAAISFPGDLSNPWIDSKSSALQADSLPAEPPGKPVSVTFWWSWRKVFQGWSGKHIPSGLSFYTSQHVALILVQKRLSVSQKNYSP